MSQQRFNLSDYMIKPLSLADFIEGNGPLQIALKTVHARWLLFGMFVRYLFGPLTPKLKTRRFQFSPHEINHLLLTQTELRKNGIKGRAVFPSHFNDAVDLLLGEGVIHEIMNSEDARWFCLAFGRRHSAIGGFVGERWLFG